MRDNVYEKIVVESEKLFFAYGIRRIAMSDIAKQLGISKKTLYQYFPTKEKLAIEVMRHNLNEQLVLKKKLTVAAKNTIEELAMMSVHFQCQLKKINPSLMLDIEKLYPEVWEEWSLFKQHVIRAQIVQMVKRGIKEGFFRPNIHAEVMADLRLLEVESVVERSKYFDKVEAGYLHEQLFEHFVTGLCTPKGLKLYQQQKVKLNKTIQTIEL